MAKIGDKATIIEWLNSQEGEYKYIIKRYRQKRSISQNSYLHLIFSFIADYGNTGYEANEIKEILKYKFLKTYSDILGYEYVRPTSSLNTKELTEFIRNIRLWSQDFLNLKIPDPNTERLIQYYNLK